MSRVLALLSLSLLVALAPGCGATDVDPVAKAATNTTDAGSSRIEFETRLSGGGQSFAFRGDGLFAYDEVRGAMTMDMSSVVPGGGDGVMEVRMVGSMMYMRLPEAFAAEGGLPSGKTWIGFDLSKALDAAGLGAMNPAQMQQDPSQMLRLLRASSSSVEEAGSAVVRGVETTRYEAKLDMRKALDATADELGLDESQRQQLRAAAEQLQKQAGVATIPVEVYVDEDGLLRRMLMKLSMTIEGERVSMRMRVDYYDFGVEVDVAAPPAGEVVDVTDEVAAGAGQG